MMLIVKVALRGVVVALTVSIAAAPVVFDGCLMTCQAPITGSQPTRAAAHSCHQAPAGALHQLHNDAQPCNHDHGQAALLTNDSGSDKQLTWTPIAATIVTLTSASIALGTSLGSPPFAHPVTIRGGTRLALPLRI